MPKPWQYSHSEQDYNNPNKNTTTTSTARAGKSKGGTRLRGEDLAQPVRRGINPLLI